MPSVSSGWVIRLQTYTFGAREAQSLLEKSGRRRLGMTLVKRLPGPSRIISAPSTAWSTSARGRAFWGSSQISLMFRPFRDISSSPRTFVPSFVVPAREMGSVVTGRTLPRMARR